MPGAAPALLAWALAEGAGKPVLCITDGAESLDTLHRDLRTLSGALSHRTPALLFFPALEHGPAHTGAFSYTGDREDVEPAGLRIEAVLALRARSAAATVIATCVQALMQKTADPESLRRQTIRLKRGDRRSLETVCRRMTENGYVFLPQITDKGQAAVRGGLLDAWPLDSAWPLRIEFSASEIESVRHFNPEDQRSAETAARADLTPSTRWLRNNRHRALPDLLPEASPVFWLNPAAVREHASTHEQAVAATADPNTHLSFTDLENLFERRRPVQFRIGDLDPSPASPALPFDLQPVQGIQGARHDAFDPDIYERVRQRLYHDLKRRAADGHRVFVCFETEGARKHFLENLPDARQIPFLALKGPLSGGFTSEAMRLAVLAETDLYGPKASGARRYDPRADRRRPAPSGANRLAGLDGLQPGELVVHMEHGIGRYLGVTEIRFDGVLQEVLTVEYADQARLHVPIAHVHVLSRYVGLAQHTVRLHKLGGRRWNAEKSAAGDAVRDLAASLLEMQAQRTLLPGRAFPPETPWMREFEASFPYRETPDQQVVIRDVTRDMNAPRPMDRLVCGDAGYGKTEVAMRAAFKAVMSETQVAVLVPTTVLAQQHYATFCDRMAPYPVRIDVLSRFRAPAQIRNTLRDMAAGRVDVVIGTHALLQDGIRFKNLGLVIIDEEQRFGVRDKETLKRLRQLVDVLTLTATPIPRTLYMSLTGARDMSLLQTPPGSRTAIETIVTPNTDDLVRRAILRELDREGQVFYLHNRILTIERAADRLTRLIPEARLAVAHGRMAPGELSGIMRRFVDGEFDLLVCTTIIESGMDIPRANTILIDRADRFGIADLYQLRGRVGRASRKAYAYLLLPAHGHIDGDARRRIGAVREHSNLGAGFHLALRDLEIRGAGNLLGSAQSGHITAVGFALYCQMLRQTVARLKGEPVPGVVDVHVKLDFISLSTSPQVEHAASLPHAYIEDENLRLEIYRRLAEAAAQPEIDALRDELRDRFGAVPESVERLLNIARLRVSAAQLKIDRIEVRQNRVMFFRSGELLKSGSRFPRLSRPSPSAKLDELIDLVEAHRPAETGGK